MKVFISWSGAPSRDVAISLRKYLPCMLQGLQVFMSQHDLESGARWAAALSKELAESNFGIICLTPDNLLSSWLLFETGAIAKNMEGRVCALLLKGLGPADLVMPLSQFQHRLFSKDDVMILVSDMNKKMAVPLEPDQLQMVFDKWWPDLESTYAAIARKRYEPDSTRAHRNERDLLEEILLRVRELAVSSDSVSSFSRVSEEGDVLSRPVGYDSLGWYTVWKFPDVPVSEFYQRQLLNDIVPGRYPLIRNIDQAIERAKAAVSAYASDAPTLFRHGTDYITKSLGFVDADFRGAHLFAEQTLEAFSRYSHLVKPTGDQASSKLTV